MAASEPPLCVHPQDDRTRPVTITGSPDHHICVKYASTATARRPTSRLSIALRAAPALWCRQRSRAPRRATHATLARQRHSIAAQADHSLPHSHTANAPITHQLRRPFSQQYNFIIYFPYTIAPDSGCETTCFSSFARGARQKRPVPTPISIDTIGLWLGLIGCPPL